MEFQKVKKVRTLLTFEHRALRSKVNLCLEIDVSSIVGMGLVCFSVHTVLLMCLSFPGVRVLCEKCFAFAHSNRNIDKRPTEHC